MTEPLLIEHDDGVDRVTLNRPDSLNALDPGLIDALNAYFESLQRNRKTRLVVLKGAGNAFDELEGTRKRGLERELDKIESLRRQQQLDGGDDAGDEDGNVTRLALEA